MSILYLNLAGFVNVDIDMKEKEIALIFPRKRNKCHLDTFLSCPNIMPSIGIVEGLFGKATLFHSTSL